MGDQAVSDDFQGKTFEDALKAAREEHGVDASAPTADEQPERQISRDEGGRFAGTETQPKPVQTDAPPAEQNLGQSDAPQAAETGDDQSIAPPQAWPKSLHGEFAGASPALKAQVLQREREFAKAIEQRTNDLKRYSSIEQAIKPYEGEIRAAGATADQAIAYLLNTHAELKRDPVGRWLRLGQELGVDVRALAQQAQAPIDPTQAYLQQQLAPLQQTVQALQQQQIAVQRAEAERVAEAFFQKNPIAREIESDMAQLAAADPSLIGDLDTLFKMALVRRPDVAAQMRAQQQAEAARSQVKAPTPKASSIRGAPAPGGSTASQPKINTFEDALAAARQEHS